MPNRREQKRAKHEAKRKEKRKEVARQAAPRSRRGLLTASLHWPVAECWVNKTWQDATQLNQVLVARRNPATGEVCVGLYLVDRACLGVKNAHAADFPSIANFHRELLDNVKQTQDMVQVDFDLAAAIVKAGLEYGASLGFSPHRDYWTPPFCCATLSRTLSSLRLLSEALRENHFLYPGLTTMWNGLWRI
jgi:hypothetical protein